MAENLRGLSKLEPVRRIDDWIRFITEVERLLQVARDRFLKNGVGLLCDPACHNVNLVEVTQLAIQLAHAEFTDSGNWFQFDPDLAQQIYWWRSESKLDVVGLPGHMEENLQPKSYRIFTRSTHV